MGKAHVRLDGMLTSFQPFSESMFFLQPFVASPPWMKAQSWQH